MSKQVKVEYEASWNCPECERLGFITNDRIENGSITHNGDSLDVICDDCEHEYEVIL